MLGLESTSSRMGNLARQEMYFKRFFSLDDMVESIEKVTATQRTAGADRRRGHGDGSLLHPADAEPPRRRGARG